MKITKKANGKSKIKISKEEWTGIGKAAKWITAQVVAGQTPESQKIAQTLDYYISLIELPNLQSDLRAKANDFINAFDAAQAQSAQALQGQV